MTAVFYEHGNIYGIGSKENIVDPLDELPPAVYLLGLTLKGWQVEKSDPFKSPPKIYGSINQKAARILNTFEARESGTGVLLVGQKGSGKTLLARSVCTQAIEKGIPVLLIGSPFCGDGFNQLIQNLKQPMIILFDEFEKTYNKEKQTELLTLLDGVFPSQKLFLFTSNDKYGLNEYMRNRPGRIYYMFEFSGIEEQFISEYAKDNLKPEMQQHHDRLLQVSTLFSSFNFDMLKAIIEEMNRYDEPPQDVITILNTKPEFSGSIHMVPTVWKLGKKIPMDWLYSGHHEFDVSVIKADFNIEICYRPKKVKAKPAAQEGKGGTVVLMLNKIEESDEDDEDEVDWTKVSVTRHDMISLSREGGMVFETPDKVHRVALKEKQYDKWDWKHMDGVGTRAMQDYD